MKKVIFTLLASFSLLPVLINAQATTTSTSTPPVATTTQEVICMQNALDKRETSLINAVETFSSSTKQALLTRSASLKLAWAATEKKERNEKRLAAYKAFRIEVQTAHTVLRNARNSAWKVFQADSRGCNIKGTGETPVNILDWNFSL